MNILHKRGLGGWLMEAGKISEKQLNIAIQIQKDKGGTLDEVLIKEGYVSKHDINIVLQDRYGEKYIQLDTINIDKSACLTIPENIARRHSLIPISIKDEVLLIAISDPLNILAIDDVKIYSGMEIETFVALQSDILKTIDRYYGNQKAMQAVEEFKKEQFTQVKEAPKIQTEIIGEDVANAPTVKLINTVIEQAVRNRASDIHIEPLEKYIKIRYRTDGILYEVMRPDIGILPSIIARIKIIGGMDIAEKRLPQDGRISIDVDGKSLDLRVSILPTIYGEKVVIRIIDKNAIVLSKEQLGLGGKELEKFNSILKAPHGIILVSGPTGSGKTTTLYSAVYEINRPEINIVTIEDPVEGKIEGVNQVQIQPKAGLSFALGLRSMLRQDPDVIMVGEIRDTETAEIAVKSAVTGHMVLSTIHTNDAVGTVLRLVDMGIEPFMVASALVGVVSQRLIKKTCSNCKEIYTPTQEELNLLEAEQIDSNIQFYHGRGCPACRGTGYNGRIGVYEILVMTSKHRELINKGCTEDELREFSVQLGMTLLKENAKKYIVNGQSTIKEYIRLAHSVE